MVFALVCIVHLQVLKLTIRSGESHSDCLTMEKFGLLSCLVLMLHTSAQPIPGTVREYIYVETNLSWYAARDYCLTHFRDLFSISNENDLQNLTDSDVQLSWIGMYRGNQLWMWIDGTISNYFNWYKAGDCAFIAKDALWHNESCTTRLSIVCMETPSWISHIASYTWSEAKDACKNNHKGLAVIPNWPLNLNATYLLYPNIDAAWIGLFKDTDNTWKWSNGDLLTYYNWATSYLCAVMDSTGYWRDTSCFDMNPFVCSGRNNSILEYKLIKEKKIWKDAQSHCKMLSMNLAMVPDQAENTRLFNYIKVTGGFSGDNLYFWIGLYNFPWYWIEALPRYIDIPKWNSMQPDNLNFRNETIHSQSCVALKDDEWYDEGCIDPHPFFCSVMVRSMILVSEPKTWEEALDHCRDRYVDLVSLVSEGEQVVALRKIQGDQNGYVWIGLRFLAGSWFWVNEDSLKYQSWLDDESQQCPLQYRCGALGVASEKWEPRSCEEKLNFLCFHI